MIIHLPLTYKRSKVDSAKSRLSRSLLATLCWRVSAVRTHPEPMPGVSEVAPDVPNAAMPVGLCVVRLVRGLYYECRAAPAISGGFGERHDAVVLPSLPGPGLVAVALA